MNNIRPLNRLEQLKCDAIPEAKAIDAFKNRYKCTKITELKYYKRKKYFKARCFRYLGNRRYLFLGTKFILAQRLINREEK